MRQRREIIADARYHVVSRTNRSEMIFNTPKIKDMFMDDKVLFFYYKFLHYG